MAYAMTCPTVRNARDHCELWPVACVSMPGGIAVFQQRKPLTGDCLTKREAFPFRPRSEKRKRGLKSPL